MITVINASTVMGMAANADLHWMHSLSPARVLIQEAKKGCASCGKASTSTSLSKGLYLSIVNSAQFKAELARLKGPTTTFQVLLDGSDYRL